MEATTLHYLFLVVLAALLSQSHSCEETQVNAITTPCRLDSHESKKAMLGATTPSVVAVVLVLLWIYLQMRHCAHDNRNPADGGVNREVIDRCPIFVYSSVKELKLGKGAVDCAVCLCEFADSETIKMLPKCEHVFHRHCIDAWLPSRITCPICRKRLTSDTVIGIDDDPTNVVPAEESEVAVTAAEQQPETETSDSSVVGQAVTSPALESRRFTPEDVRREIVANHGRIRLPGAWSRKTAWNASDSDQKRWFLSLSASKSCSLFT